MYVIIPSRRYVTTKNFTNLVFHRNLPRLVKNFSHIVYSDVYKQ